MPLKLSLFSSLLNTLTNLCLNIFNELFHHENKKGLCIQRVLYRIARIIYSVDSDQTPRSVTSDLELYCLHMSRFVVLGRKG